MGTEDDIDYFVHLRQIMDQVILSISALYERGDRSRDFAEACRRLDRSARLLKAARRIDGDPDEH